MANVKDAASNLKSNAKNQANRAEHEIDDLGDLIQKQVTELVNRVTGVKEARRQYLSMGLSAGVLVGVIVGIAIGIAMQDDDDEVLRDPYENTYTGA